MAMHWKYWSSLGICQPLLLQTISGGRGYRPIILLPRDPKDDNDARPARHPGQEQKFSIDHFVYPQIDSLGQNWGWDLIEINQIKDSNGREIPGILNLLSLPIWN